MRSFISTTLCLLFQSTTTAGELFVDDGWLRTAQAVVVASEYAVREQQAPNRAHGLRTVFAAGGIRVEPRTGDGDRWTFGLTLAGVGRGDALQVPPSAALHAHGNRMEYRRGSLIEWYVNDPRGLEQGFTLAIRPNGDGPLRLAMTVEGDLTGRESDGGRVVDFERPPGVRVLRLDHLVVSDRDGRGVPARFAFDGTTLSLVIDDATATYPLLIDPLLTSPSWMITGGQAGAQLGTSVATAGDVNGDGYSDVIVGAPEFDVGSEGEGRALVFLGSPAGLSTSPSWTADGGQALASFGFAVATAGDVDGDGCSDVLVGARHFDGAFADEGRASLYLGGSTGLAANPVWTATGGQAGARFGHALGPAGDVNGDGFADVVVGAPTVDQGAADAGAAFVYVGSSAGLAAAPAWSGSSQQFGAAFGTSVATAGDVDGDGFADVVVGAPFFDPGTLPGGAAFVYFGSAGVEFTAPPVRLDGQVGSWHGYSVSTAGDVDGDGYADVIVGAPRHSDGEFGEGGAFVYLGAPDHPLQTAPWSDTGDQVDAEFGHAVATAGDVNGDGRADVVVGARFFDAGVGDEGAAYVYLGSPAGPSLVWSVMGSVAGAQLGNVVSTAGDVDGDGCADVIVGARFYHAGQAGEGAAFVYRGTSGGVSAEHGWSASGEQATANLGWSVASAGDVDGDGCADVIVGAYAFDAGEVDEGRAFLFRGSSGGLATAPDWTAEGDQADAWFGYSVAAAGDVNGDGFVDVLVGAPKFDDGEVDEGRVLVYLGAEAGLASVPAWTVESDQTDGQLGRSVSSAGDVNGDGFGDVLYAAFGGTGLAAVHHGTSAGPAATPAWSVPGPFAALAGGAAVASAGDVDRDGYSDVLVASSPGSASVAAYHGGVDGLSDTAAWSTSFATGYVSVAGAADVNGDGYADVLVGAAALGIGGRAYVYHGGVFGLAPTPAWEEDVGDAGADYGWSVSTAGDVNGDGCADVVVGAPHFDGGEADEGRAYVYRGSPAGVMTTASWIVESDVVGARFGSAVATAGDVNGDGYADVLVGAPGFTGGFGGEGRASLYYGNEGPGIALNPRPRTIDGNGPIAHLGATPADGFRVAALGRTPFGRGRVRLQAEIRHLGTTFDGPVAGVVVDSDLADVGVDGVELSALVNELSDGLYHWRARLLPDRTSLPFLSPSRWVSDARDGWQEADVRVRKGVARFVPGDRLIGKVDGLGHTASASFQGLEGMTLTLTIPKTSTETTFVVVIADASGRVEKSWTVQAGPNDKTKRKWTLATDDEYTVRLVGVAGAGAVELVTDRKLPASAKPHVDVQKATKGTGATVFVAQGLPGGVLSATFTPRKGFAGPMTLAFKTPAGVVIDVTAFQQATADGGLLLAGVPLDQAGEYEIEVGGFGPKKKAKVKGALAPVQPPPGTATVEML